jgi:hypothetical protein
MRKEVGKLKWHLEWAALPTAADVCCKPNFQYLYTSLSLFLSVQGLQETTAFIKRMAKLRKQPSV